MFAKVILVFVKVMLTKSAFGVDSNDHDGIDNAFVCPSVPFHVPDSSDDFCNHRSNVCSGADVARDSMKCAGVDGVCTVKPDSVDCVARFESECNGVIVCECSDVGVCSVEADEIDPKVTVSR